MRKGTSRKSIGLPKNLCSTNWQENKKPDYELLIDNNLKEPKKLFCLLRNTEDEKTLIYAKQIIPQTSEIPDEKKSRFLAIIVNHPKMIRHQPDCKKMVENALRKPTKFRDFLEETLRKNVIDYAEQRIPGTSRIPDGEKVKFLEIIMNHPIRTGQLFLAPTM